MCVFCVGAHVRAAINTAGAELTCRRAINGRARGGQTDHLSGSMVLLAALLPLVAAAALPASAAASGSLKDVKHVVFFMQENRAFDHYFGTMAGVRGFGDPNVHISKNTNKPMWHQPVDDSLEGPKPPSHVKELYPWYLNHQGGDWKDRTQCMIAGSNDWIANHAAWNHGQYDRWVRNNTPYSIGYYRREDLPLHFKLAESFLVGDAYHESVISSTDPNRITWLTGTINTNTSEVGGHPRKLGGPVIDNTRSPGCSKTDVGAPMTCNPKRWKTVPEYLMEAGITFQFYQDHDNFGCDPLVQFQQYKDAAKKKEELARRGTSYPGLEKFYQDAHEGKLPEVSYVVPPTDLSEHPPYTPRDGAWLQRKVAHAVMHGKAWNNTVYILSYDETGGWADHVMSPHAPRDEPGEWMLDPYNHTFGQAPTGPGFRLPFYIISPWTRNGGVFTEPTSHESQIMFLEEWAKAHGKPFHSKEMNPWRRKHMSNLLNALDFSKYDTSVPDLPHVPTATKDPVTHRYNGATVCQKKFDKHVQPKIPYGEQNLTDALRVEKGFKPMRGNPTEGRYLTFESGKYALSHKGNKVSAGKKSSKHNEHDQLFVLHWLGSNPRDLRFRIATPGKQMGKAGKYITQKLGLSSNAKDAAVFEITFENGGYSVVDTQSHKHLALDNGKVSLKGDCSSFSLYSVTI